MDTELAFCPQCGRKVHLAFTRAPAHEGHATLADGPELVCLDVQECPCGTCALTDLARPVMAVRLAQSGLGHPGTVRMRCTGCGEVGTMEVVDGGTALCPVCGTPNHWVLAELATAGRPDHGLVEATR